ncbi:MAG: chromosome condensation regulator [Hyperionvirus sp.]|uniref:Chromosome condensation regulator n=1 Tax=Hyperionvirus sp. TaxID=2487770 RepID=A0A3G5A8Z0_9VIRU|nr:MAG: chromosome condensation regulator [Hyperionvirus sp.]
MGLDFFMDICSLIGMLPVDLQYIVISYDNLIIFLLSDVELMKYDWFILIKIIFGRNYSREFFTNEVMMKIYLSGCRKFVRKLLFRDNTIIKLRDGRLMGSGSNYLGHMGFGDEMSRYLFSVIENVPQNIIEIGVNMTDTTLRLSDGTLMRSSIFTKRKFKKIKLKRKNIVEIISGSGRSKFIRFSNGTILGYGYGFASDSVFSKPCFKKIDYVRNVADVYCGVYHSFLRLMDGRVMAHGFNQHGQLGLGDKMDRKNFTEVGGLDDKGNIVEIIVGHGTTIIRLVDGSILCCGNNSDGQLGFGDIKNLYVFSQIKHVPGNIDRIVFGCSHTFILLTNGVLMCSGNNSNGQLGLGDLVDKYIFTEVAVVPKNIVEVYCGYWDTIIRLEDGTLLGTGANFSGELGLGDSRRRISFEEITPLPKNIAEVVCYSTGTLIRFLDGTLMGSGNNQYGELGLGLNISCNRFTKINGIDGFVIEIA